MASDSCSRKLSISAGDLLLGPEVMAREGGWNLLCKFFDNMGPIPHHLHQSDEFAKLVGQRGKPEAYYFPPQYNLTENNFPYTFMGLEPGTTKAGGSPLPGELEQGRQRHPVSSPAPIGWSPVPDGRSIPGILHAPGSLVTYEPQVNSDVFAMFQSLVEGRVVDWSLLVKDVLPEYHHDLDYLLEPARLGCERESRICQTEPCISETVRMSSRNG